MGKVIMFENKTLKELKAIAKSRSKSKDIPPVEVLGKKSKSGKYILRHGHHRFLGGKKAGNKTIWAWVTPVDKTGRIIKLKKKIVPKRKKN